MYSELTKTVYTTIKMIYTTNSKFQSVINAKLLYLFFIVFV